MWIYYGQSLQTSQLSMKPKKKNPDFSNSGTWYNTDICSKLHGTVFEDFIRNAITDRYNLMCCITAHDKQQPTYVDDLISVGGIAMPKNETTAALQSLDATLFFH